MHTSLQFSAYNIIKNLKKSRFPATEKLQLIIHFCEQIITTAASAEQHDIKTHKIIFFGHTVKRQRFNDFT